MLQVYCWSQLQHRYLKIALSALVDWVTHSKEIQFIHMYIKALTFNNSYCVGMHSH